jgi:DNA-binding winged helix-turn-helix (wHTH) protein
MDRRATSNAGAATPPGDKAGRRGVLSFRPFHLDPEDARLWRGKRALSLKPKSFAVLHYLVTHAGRLVTKRQLLDAVWGDVHVGDAVLKTAVKEIRQALGDSIEAPRFVATVHRRGYRFIAPVDGGGQSAPVGPWSAARSSGFPFLPSQARPAHPLVGRDAELARLHESLAEALEDGRRVVLVTGAPGMGKSALLDAFLSPLAARADLWVARGQCPRQEGPGEPYLAILEALGSLCREPGAAPVLVALRRYAPMWLAQLPALMSEAGWRRCTSAWRAWRRSACSGRWPRRSRRSRPAIGRWCWPSTICSGAITPRSS